MQCRKILVSAEHGLHCRYSLQTPGEILGTNGRGVLAYLYREVHQRKDDDDPSDELAKIRKILESQVDSPAVSRPAAKLRPTWSLPGATHPREP